MIAVYISFMVALHKNNNRYKATMKQYELTVTNVQSKKQARLKNPLKACRTVHLLPSIV